MTGTISESVIRKAKKLMNLASSSNENEAALAANMMQELLLRHGLSVSDLTVEDTEKEEVEETPISYGGPSEIVWKTKLLSAIARTNLCKIIVWSEYKRMPTGKYRANKYMKLIGKPTAMFVAAQMYIYLVAAVDRVTRNDPHFNKQTSNSFRLGVVARLRERLIEKMEKMQNEGIKPNTENPSSCTALAVIDYVKREQLAVENYIAATQGKLTTTAVRKISNFSAYNAGREAGSRINLDSQIVGQRQRKLE